LDVSRTVNFSLSRLDLARSAHNVRCAAWIRLHRGHIDTRTIEKVRGQVISAIGANERNRIRQFSVSLLNVGVALRRKSPFVVVGQMALAESKEIPFRLLGPAQNR
jgi:hypothetical protein